MTHSKKFYKRILLLSVSIGLFLVFLLYFLTFNQLVTAFLNYEGGLQIIIVISCRIILASVTAYYLLHKWFKQEAQYLSDIPFLLSLFFLLLIFGKLLDFHSYFLYYLIEDLAFLIYTKIRYYLIIVEFAPILYLGFEIIFFRLEDKFQRLRNKEYMNQLRLKLIILIIIIEIGAVSISPTVLILTMLLPTFLIPSFMGIVYIFILAFRYNRLSVVKPKILTIGFSLLLGSSIVRMLLFLLLGENAGWVIFVEVIDLSIYIIVFFGLYKKR